MMTPALPSPPIAKRAAIETDIDGWYTVVVDDLTYNAETGCFSFTYDSTLHHIPRERVQVIRELKEKA